MKCPYRYGNVSQAVEYIYEYNENGEMSSCTHKLIETHQMEQCLQEECAAWRDGHCGYKA